jgi:hypothetical protein
MVPTLLYVFFLLVSSPHANESNITGKTRSISQSVTNKLDSGYIKLQFIGEVNKPYPAVIFYLSNSIDIAREPFTNKIEVSKIQFDSIISAINRKKDKDKMPVLAGPFQFTISKNKEISYLTTTNKNLVTEIVNDIIKSFTGTKRNEVNASMKALISRLGLSIRL